MLTHTGRTVHLGVGYVFSPQPVLDSGHVLDFQRELAAHGLEFSQAHQGAGALHLGREVRPIEVTVQQLGPAIGSLSVVAGAPWATIDEFVDDARIAFSAFSAVWSGQPLQILQRECTLRRLFDVTEDHAFKFLWEKRLRGNEAELDAFRRPVLGGGLRFVIPPESPQTDEPNIDVRIESFFPDPTKLFVELQMRWNVMQVSAAPDPDPIMREADRFLAEEVVNFIRGEGI